MSPRTLEKVKVVTHKKVLEFKRDIVFGDDNQAMAQLTKMLLQCRSDKQGERAVEEKAYNSK